MSLGSTPKQQILGFGAFITKNMGIYFYFFIIELLFCRIPKLKLWKGEKLLSVMIQSYYVCIGLVIEEGRKVG